MSSTGAQTWTIPPRGHDGPTPLSFPQERLFLLDRIMPGLSAYNVPTLVSVNRTLEAELVRQACEAIVQRHEVLRTTIELFDGVPLQVVSPPQRFELTVFDLRAAPDAEADAHERLAELASRPFDLAADVLLRAALVHLSADQDLLLIVFHHAGSDHASRKLLFDELDALYTALEAGSEPVLPELPIQYSDFAQWQRRRLDGEPLRELVSYWTEQLAGAPERLDLPTDRPRPAAQSYRGRLREFTIEPELAGALRELARGQRATQFMVLLAGFKTLLHRYTGVADLVVGTPVSGRRHQEITKLLGYFSNTLALRSDLSGDPTFAELIARVKATTIGAQVHQALPFEKLVETLNPERAESHSPIFQVLFGFDIASAQAPTLAGAELQMLPVPGWHWSRFDLSMVLRELPDGALHARVEYPTDLFDAASIDRLVGHFQTLLEAVATDPGQHLSELPMLTDPEQCRFAQWNETSRPYDRRAPHELFAEQAARTPDAVAVVCGEQRITFSELDRRSNQLARELRRLGAGAGTLVGICLDRSVELVAALLGVLRSGSAYVPIEPTYPPQRQEFMLADAGAPVLVTQDRMLGLVDPRGAAVLSLDRDSEAIAAHSAEPLGLACDPEQLAYVIYTSGSTGAPKGVEVTHRSVANLLAHMRERPGIGERDVLANLTTPAFDLSVPDWYLPLITGARLVIVPRDATLDGVDLADWLARSGATFVQATPTTWQLLVDAGWKGSTGLKIVCGGEALPRALADALLRRGASLWHMYGPTETTVWSSVLQLGDDHDRTALGGPIANTTFHVLDGNRRPVPIGIPGELFIGGQGLARGYRDRAQLTSEQFVEDPFAAAGRPGRLYRTGDLVRWREDRTLEFHGRIDQQVKLRGFRIELGEIEAVLDSHQDVTASAAAVREDAPGDRRLVAYLVPAPGARPEIEELRRRLKMKLPPFMVPSAFVTLESFPMTANGKLDRQALPPPDGARPDLARSYMAPQTPVQEELAAIWGEVLGLDRVGIDDDFFELGGHSLLAVRMLARVQDTLGLELYLGRVFERSTIRGLAELVTEEMLAEVADEDVAALLADL